jgi:hypothetical protein
MEIDKLSELEIEKSVSFVLRPDGESFAVKGKKAVVKEVLELIEGQGDSILAALREREGWGEEVVEQVVKPKVRPLSVQQDEYRAWFAQRSEYYWPSEEQIQKIWSTLQEGDQTFPDYALTISVRKIDGRIIAVDRRGRELPVSPYSPALALGK